MGTQFYYRGYLTSCNYSCEYCPFSKRKMTAEQEKKDREALEKFLCQMEAETEEHALQIVPYGEALVHSYYWEAMAKFSRIRTEVYTGCQTNLSFPVEQMVSFFESCGGEKRKLRLWCTFHPSMTSVDTFVSQCRKLAQAGIAYCVGVVGDPDEYSSIQTLREELPEEIYVWINRMEGRKKRYTETEIQEFQKIDPYFFLELQHFRADSNLCRHSVFQEAKGDRYFCNLHAAQAGRSSDNHSCKRKECNCYLAYCNRMDIKELLFFQPYPAFRIPVYPKGIFLDVDGTLIAEGERALSDSLTEKIRWLAKKSKLYLATALPFAEAMAKCRKIIDCLSGGVFADGGHILVWKQTEHGQRKILWEEVKSVGTLSKSLRCRTYQIRGVVYKYTLLCRRKQGWMPGEAEALIQKIENSVNNRDSIKIHREKRHIGITSVDADKKTGVEMICTREGIAPEEGMAIGNDAEDLPMLSLFPRSLYVE